MSPSPDLQELSPIVRLLQAGIQFPGQRTHTLQEITLDVNPGEILAIVGPSGCGKSTLLRMLADLLPLSCGRRTVSSQSDSTDSLAMVFQDARLLPWRTVLGNMQLPFELIGQKVDQQQIGRLLELTGLQKDDFNKFPRMLSGGMKMRVSVARSLVLNPKLLLLDEPFAAVDDLLREQLNCDLLKLQRQFGFSVVLVTHHIGEAVFLSDRLLVMSSLPGQILEEIPTPWPRQRGPSLRTSLEFATHCGQVKKRLQGF